MFRGRHWAGFGRTPFRRRPTKQDTAVARRSAATALTGRPARAPDPPAYSLFRRVGAPQILPRLLDHQRPGRAVVRCNRHVLLVFHKLRHWRWLDAAPRRWHLKRAAHLDPTGQRPLPPRRSRRSIFTAPAARRSRPKVTRPAARSPVCLTTAFRELGGSWPELRAAFRTFQRSLRIGDSTSTSFHLTPGRRPVEVDPAGPGLHRSPVRELYKDNTTPTAPVSRLGVEEARGGHARVGCRRSSAVAADGEGTPARGQNWPHQNGGNSGRATRSSGGRTGLRGTRNGQPPPGPGHRRCAEFSARPSFQLLGHHAAARSRRRPVGDNSVSR